MLKKIKETYYTNKLVYLIMSLAITIILNMKIKLNNTIVFDVNNITEIVVFCTVYLIFSRYKNYSEKNIFSNILGILLSLVYVFGELTKSIWIRQEVIISTSVVIFIFLKFISLYILFNRLIRILFKYISTIKVNNVQKKDYFKPNKRNFIIITIIFLIVWSPYFLNYYPGITSFDTNYQLLQGYGKCNYSNHHPVLHTVIITNIVEFGHIISGNFNFGIAMCSIIQMFLCACTFSFVIYYLGKKEFCPIIKTITFLFFAFCPFVPQLSIAIWKDVPFALCMILFIIGLLELVKYDNLLKRKKYIFFFSIIITLIMFFRNNGVYIILLTLPFVVILKKKSWKNILSLFIIPITFYFIITGPIYTKLGIVKSLPREMLSIPIQQMARIVKYKSDSLSDEDKNIINQYIPVENVAELYNPTISDPVKNEFNDGTFNLDKINLIKLYIKLAVKYPGETLVAFLGNTYGYYYPEVVTYAITTETYQSPFEAEQFLDIHRAPIIEIKFLDNILNSIYEKKIPIVSLVANIGFEFWLFMFFMFYCIYRKKTDILVAYIPILALYLTCLASPVSGELRYIYSMFLCMPILCAYSIDKK